jgi:3-dehydroquinate synthase
VIDLSKHNLPKDVVFGSVDSILLDLDFIIAEYNNFICITDTNVAKTEVFKTYITQISSKIMVDVLIMPAGEVHKNETTKQKLEQQIFAKGYRRNIVILAIGGGVVLDVAGFVAATFCRGVKWLAVPTSLMAMVDVCVGGKTGLNTKYGKNTLGAIYPAQKSFILLEWLTTLPAIEYKWALPEVIKMAVIYDYNIVKWLLNNSENLYKFNYNNTSTVSMMIKLAVAMKYYFVKDDMLDFAKRRFLNFGHTLAHAIEMSSDWKIKHGQAVSIGMLFALQLNKNKEFFQVLQLLKKLDCFFILNIKDKNKLWQACCGDKKINKHGQINWVVIKNFGSPVIIDSISKHDFLSALEKLENANKDSYL